MNKKKQKKELQTRREFFKDAAKSALPMIAGILLTVMPQVTNAKKTVMGCEIGCYTGCSRGCKERCQGCQGGCNTHCAVSCDRKCNAICSDNCYKSCTGGNQAYRE